MFGPNITGSAKTMLYGEFASYTTRGSGAIYPIEEGLSKSNTSAWSNSGTLAIDASRVSLVYNDALTVQPNSAQVLMIIKV